MAAWLTWLETLHPASVELGLGRVAEVAERLDVAQPAAPVITVAGTNGKGSVCAFLEGIALAEGRSPGLYSSPHLGRYNERVRLGGVDIDDAALIASFEQVEAARDDVPLTFFEFGTLAALVCFRARRVDPIILEVGLGGRLDATNVVAADVAVISSIGVDHVEWLGRDREAVAAEKAGIARSDRPLVIAEPDLPGGWYRVVAATRAREIRYGRDFAAGTDADGGWWLKHGAGRYEGLPPPALLGECQVRNAATAAVAWTALTGSPPSSSAVATALRSTSIPGRMEKVYLKNRDVEVIFDVAHNPQAASEAARGLAAMPASGRTLCVTGMYADKDVAGVARALAPCVDAWLCATLEPPRGLAASELAAQLTASGEVTAATVADCGGLDAALAAALRSAVAGDRVLITGSFATVAQLRGHFL